MSIDVRLSATDAGFTSTISRVRSSVSGLETSVGSMVKAGAALAIGFGAIKMAGAAISATFGTFKEALDLGGELKDLSARTGETAGNLLVLRRAFDNAGAGADKVGPSINKLQKFLDDASHGGAKNNEVLGRLGLTMADMAGKTPTEQMAMLASKLNGVSDSGERSALVMSIFGKGAGALLPVMADFSNEIQTAKNQLGSMPLVMDSNASAFDNISDNINVAKGKFMEFAAGLLTSIAPALELATDLMTRFDAAGAGMKLGAILTGASNAMGGFNDALSAVKLGEFGLAFKIAFESIKLQAADSMNSIYANISAAIQASATFLITAFGPGSGIFTIISAQFDILAAKFQLAMIEGIKAISTVLVGMFDTPLLNAARAINPIFDSILSGIEGVATGWEGAISSIDKDISNSQNKISNSIGQIAGDFKLAGQEAGKMYNESVKSATKLIDTSVMEIELQKQRVELKKLELSALQDAAVAATKKLSIEQQGINIGKERVKHEERIKELDIDIAAAKRKGNREELASLESIKAYHLELQASKEKGLSLQEAINNANKAQQTVINGVIEKNKDELKVKKDITGELLKQLNLSKKIGEDTREAQQKDRLDRGGRLGKEASEAIGERNFAGGRRIERQLQHREFDRDFKKEFGMQDVKDLAKEKGIDTFRKNKKQLQEELIKKRQDELKPGADGKKGDMPGAAPKAPAEAPATLLQKAVDAIKIAVESLEKKLPVPALGA